MLHSPVLRRILLERILFQAAVDCAAVCKLDREAQLDRLSMLGLEPPETFPLSRMEDDDPPHAIPPMARAEIKELMDAIIDRLESPRRV